MKGAQQGRQISEAGFAEMTGIEWGCEASPEKCCFLAMNHAVRF